jgi:replicative DNA helicase
MIIETPCEELNSLLQGGIPKARISMFLGRPGVGKTRMMMDFAFEAMRRGLTVEMSVKNFEDVSGYFTTDEGMELYKYIVSNRDRPDIYLFDDMSPFDKRRSEVERVSHYGTTAIVFGSGIGLRLQYACALIAEILNHQGHIKLRLMKNRYGGVGMEVDYPYQNMRMALTKLRNGLSGPVVVDHNLDAMTFREHEPQEPEKPKEEPEEIDHTGETYNPLTGKWKFL